MFERPRRGLEAGTAEMRLFRLSCRGPLIERIMACNPDSGKQPVIRHALVSRTEADSWYPGNKQTNTSIHLATLQYHDRGPVLPSTRSGKWTKNLKTLHQQPISNPTFQTMDRCPENLRPIAASGQPQQQQQPQ